MMTAAIYARYSTDRQDEASIADQLRVCRMASASHGWSVGFEFTDEAISGSALGNRPGVQQMLEAAWQGKIQVLIVLELWRLARSEDLPKLIQQLKFRGVRVIGVQDGFDSNARTARMQAGMSAIMGGQFIEMVSQRTHSALEMRAREQRPTGGKAYGYDTTGQPLAAESEIIQEIFSRYADGEAMKSIASDLNVRNVPSPGSSWQREHRRKDGRWLVSALHAILHNERYIGQVIWNRSQWVKDPDSGKRSRRERPRSEWIITEGPALVGRATWDRSQSRLKERETAYTGGAGGQPRYLLSGILQCSECTAKLVVTGAKGAHYYCSSYRHGGEAACAMSVGVRRDVAEIVVLQPVRNELFSPAAVDRVIMVMREWHRQERSQTVFASPDLVKVDAAIADLRALIAEDPTREEILRPALDAQLDRQAVLRRKAWKNAAARGTQQEIPAERAYRDHVQRMTEVLNGDNISAARAVLRQVLGDVPVWPDTTKEHLIAKLMPNPVPLLKAAGVDASSGSGGLLCGHALILPLVKPPE